VSKKSNPVLADELLTKIVSELIKKHKCHTIVLYGSRARGDATSSSDYDLMGVVKNGSKLRLAEKRKGVYLDIFIYPEKLLKQVGESHFYMKDAKVIYEEKDFGTRFIKKLNAALKKKYVPLPAAEIEMLKLWLHKMFDRIAQGDIEGNYRRSWLHEALLIEYFNIRKKRYWGSKQSFEWLRQNDVEVLKLFEQVLANPLDLTVLEKLVVKVSKRKITK